jgi:hypothetical protein
VGKRKLDLINQDNLPVQLSLLSAPGTEDRGLEERAFPKIVRDAAGFKEVLRRAEKLGLLGLDYEFRSYDKPTVMGISVRDLACGIPFDRTLHRYIADAARSGIKLVAHSGFGADLPVFAAVEGFEPPYEWLLCSMIVHWFENSHLTKAPSKDESDDAGALGFMDLWSAASLTTRVSMWKDHRGSACHGPCPKCDVFGYCAVDSWGGLESFIVNRERLLRRGFLWQTYERRAQLAYHLEKMQRNGVRVDREFAAKFDANSEKLKEQLFPVDEKGECSPFNPRSSDQVVEWFRQRKILLRSNQKNDIRKALELQAARQGYASIEDLDQAEELPETLSILHRLDQYKGSGKGISSWISDKHIDKDGLMHPRFIYVGTSTGRLSSSRPNAQNWPSRGWGALIKAAIVPHENDFDIIDADLGQLELRDVLYQAGFDISSIKGDALKFIVSLGGDRFDRAARLAVSSEKYELDPAEARRDIVKTVVYGGMYGEGLTIYTANDLFRPTTQREIANGAIRLYTPQYVPWLLHPWEYGGGIVGFTGANLAERLFGDKTYQSRKKALEIQDDLIFGGDLKIIREWQIKVCQHIELNGSVTLSNGQFLRLNGSSRDNAKVGLAFMGQGLGAVHAQATMLACIRENKHLPLLQVHDSLVYAVNRSWSDIKVREFISPMFGETEVLPGFKAPGKVKRGRNYGGFDKDLNPGGLKLIWNSAVEDLDGRRI